MEDLVVTCAHTGATLATISRWMADNGSEFVRAQVLPAVRPFDLEPGPVEIFPVDPLSPAVATYRAQVWIESVLEGSE